MKEAEHVSRDKRCKELELFILEGGSVEMMVVLRFLSDGKGMWLVLHGCEGKNRDSGMEGFQ